MTSVLIIGNGKNRCQPELSFNYERTIQCNRVYDGFKKDIIIRNLNTTLEHETGLSWQIVVSEFSEVWIAFAHPTLDTLEAQESAYRSRLQAAYEQTKAVLNPNHILRFTSLETMFFLVDKLKAYPPHDTGVTPTPTTGLMAIQECLSLGWDVTITGFTFFDGRYRIGTHFPLKEQAYCEELIEEGRLRVI